MLVARRARKAREPIRIPAIVPIEMRREELDLGEMVESGVVVFVFGMGLEVVAALFWLAEINTGGRSH